MDWPLSNSGNGPAKVLDELTCAVQQVGGRPNPQTLKEIAEGFQNTWAALARKGNGWPSQAERRHFYAQIIAETGGLRIMSEQGGGSASVRSSAGGSKYKGRGPIQLTFCYHYAGYARFLNGLQGNAGINDLFRNGGETQQRCPNPDIANHPVVANPEGTMGDSARTKHLAAGGSVFWWEKKKRESPAFRNAINSNGQNAAVFVSRGVNGGDNGMPARLSAYAKIGGCLNAEGIDDSGAAAPTSPEGSR